MVRLTRRLILWIGAGIAGVLVLLAVALVAVVAFIDPNRFKPRIVQAVQEQTGRQLTLRGDLHWRVFPWLVVNAGDGSLGNPASLGAGEFARWQALRIGVKLLPLLHKEVIVDSIRAEGVVVNLHRDASGRVNWQFDTPQTASAAPTPLQIDSLELHQATLHYADAQSGLQADLTDLMFKARLPPGTTTRSLRIDALEFSATVATAALGGAPVAVTFSAASLAFDVAAGRLSAPEWRATFGPAQLTGALSGSFGAAPVVSGTLQLQTDSLRSLLVAAGVTAPVTRDPATLGRFELAGALRYAGDGAQVTALRLRLDDTRMQGSASLASLADRSIVFDLAGDRIDLDRYLEPADTQGKPLVLPLAQLKALQLSGELRLEEARMGGALLKGVKLKLASAGPAP